MDAQYSFGIYQAQTRMAKQSSKVNYSVDLTLNFLTMLSTGNQTFFFFFQGKAQWPHFPSVSSLLLCSFFCEIKLGHICLAVLLIKPQLKWGLSFGCSANLLSVLSLTVLSCLWEKKKMYFKSFFQEVITFCSVLTHHKATASAFHKLDQNYQCHWSGDTEEYFSKKIIH